MILSLDCSTTCIGWAVFEGDDLIEYGKLEPTVAKLDWKSRIENLLPQVDELIDKYKPTKIYQEQVPMGGKGGNLVLSQLFYLQGALSVVESIINKIPVEYIEVATWRHNVNISSGDKHRDSKKIKSIEKANELFGLNLAYELTKGGNYKSGDDDCSDAILIYASTREKYRKPLVFGKRRRIS